MLSKPDIHLLALSYELEVERNGGDWRLRNEPAQRELNGKPPVKEEAAEEKETQGDGVEQLQNLTIGEEGVQEPVEDKAQEPGSGDAPQEHNHYEEVVDEVTQEEIPDQDTQQTGAEDAAQEVPADDEDDDSDGWITPSNLKKHQAKDTQASGSSEAIQETLQAALLTSDFAMQNVALRINLKYGPLPPYSVHSRIKMILTHHTALSPRPTFRVSKSSRHGSCAATVASTCRDRWTDSSAPSADRPPSHGYPARLTATEICACT